MPIGDPQELFLHELCELYDAEHRFLEGQREMAEQTSDVNLGDAIRDHIEQTDQHARNLEEVFGELGEEPRRETNEVAQGLVSEAQEGIQEAQNDAIRDCAIDAAIIKVEHFEIGSYRAMLALAAGLQMGHDEIVNVLEQNLRQEEAHMETAERSARALLDKAGKAATFQRVRRAKREQEQQDKGLIDKAKDKLTGE